MPVTRYCARCLNTFFEEPEVCPSLACGRPRPEGGWGVLLGPGDLLDRRYRITRALAVGGAGLTYLAREVDEAGVAVEPDLAIKVLYSSRDGGSYLRRLSMEAQILQQLDDEHIVRCHGFVHRAGQAPYLVTRFEHGGSLSAHVERAGPLPPRAAAGILRQILRALDVAHQRGVVHRDLKPENVLLAEPVDRDEVPHVRVADFGIAKVYGGIGERLTRLGAFVGTPEFAAPEQFEGVAPTPATDVFAAGALLWYLVTGAPPVDYGDRLDIESCHAQLLASIPPRLPASEDPGVAALQDVLDHVLLPEAGDRWTISQVQARLASLADAPAPSRRTVETTNQGAPGREAAPPRAHDPTFAMGTVDFTERVEKVPRPPPPPVAPSAGEEEEELPDDDALDLEGDPPPRGRGWLWLGVAALVLTTGAVALAVVVAAGGAAVLVSRPEPSPPAVVAPPPPTDDPKALAARVRRVAADAGRVCGARGELRVGVTVEAAGALTAVSIDPASQGDADTRACIEQKLRESRVERVGRDAVELREAVDL